MHVHTKAKPIAADTQLLLGCLAPLRHSSLVWQILLGQAVQVSQIEIAEFKIPQQLCTTKRDKDSWEFASPVDTRLPGAHSIAG